MIKYKSDIILDSSAIVAILFMENEMVDFLKRMEKARQCLISAVNFVEASMVLTRKETGLGDLKALMKDTRIKIVPVTVRQSHLAFEAFQRYGKGRHEARLNLGDCFAYALAKDKDLPLLAKGNDFRRTDVKLA